MRISDMKIGVRLGIAFAFVAALPIGTTAADIQRLNDNNTEMGRVIDERYSLIALSNQIRNSGYKVDGILSSLLLVTSTNQKTKYTNDYAATHQVNGQTYGRLGRVLTTDASRALFEGQFEMRFAYDASVRKFSELIGANKFEDTRILHQSDMSRLQDQYYVLIDKVVDHRASEMEHGVGETAVQGANTRIQMTVLAVLITLLAVATGGFIIRTIAGPIHHAVHLTEAVTQSDLTHRLEVGTQDEIGRLLAAPKYMTEDLHGIVNRVCGGTDTVTRASHEVASGNVDLSSRTEQQVSSPEEMAAAMEQLTPTVKQNADNTQGASRLAPSTSLMAAKSGDAVDETIETTSTISALSRKTVNITGVIDSIAFQTDILALNAATEVTHAGEQGQGFAVMAGEVYNLAQRGVAAAEKIKRLIEDPVDHVDANTARIEEADQIVRDVVAGIQNVTNIVAEASASSCEQSEGIEWINKAIMQMGKVTQEDVSLAEESMALTQTLQDQVDQLAEIVSAFGLHSDMPGHVYGAQGETAIVTQAGWA